jgi:hypothetical protein
MLPCANTTGFVACDLAASETADVAFAGVLMIVAVRL